MNDEELIESYMTNPNTKIMDINISYLWNKSSFYTAIYKYKNKECTISDSTSPDGESDIPDVLRYFMDDDLRELIKKALIKYL